MVPSFQYPLMGRKTILTKRFFVYYFFKRDKNVLLQDPVPFFEPGNNIDLSMTKHICPIAWENIILYGDYILNREKVKI